MLKCQTLTGTVVAKYSSHATISLLTLRNHNYRHLTNGRGSGRKAAAPGVRTGAFRCPCLRAWCCSSRPRQPSGRSRSYRSWMISTWSKRQRSASSWATQDGRVQPRISAPGLLTIITGSSGIGKTVMLSEAEGIARNHGWAVISRTATPGFLSGVGDDMLRLLDELGDGPPSRKITAFSAAGFGPTTQLPRNGPSIGAGPGTNCCACWMRKAQDSSSPSMRSMPSTGRKSPSWPPTPSTSSATGCPSA